MEGPHITRASPERLDGKRLTASFEAARASWLDRLFAWRDRLLASPGFHRWATAFPLTRPLANRHARTLFDLCAGFVYSQVLTACIRLELFDKLASGPQTPERLAAVCGLPPESMQRLLDAAVALGLLMRRGGGRYGLAMLGAALRGNPGIAAMVTHHAHLYEDLRDPVALLRGGAPTRLGAYWPYAAGAADPGAESVAAYTALMASSQGLIADDILAAYDFRRHRQLLDIGGGDGTFLINAARHAPELLLTLVDLPAVAETAAARLVAEGLENRASAVGGNFLVDVLPSGADLVTLIRILLDHDDSGALAILRAARGAIAEGGTLLVAETVSGLSGSRAVTDAYFGLYLFAMGRGRPRTLPQLKALLTEAGFSHVRPLKTRRPLLTSVVAAQAGHK